MKKIIRLTEGQLYRLIEQTLDEISYRNELGSCDPYCPSGDTPLYQDVRQKDGSYKTTKAPNPYDDDEPDENGWYHKKSNSPHDHRIRSSFRKTIHR